MIKDVVAWFGIIFQIFAMILCIYFQLKFGGWYTLIMVLYSVAILSFLIQSGLDNLKLRNGRR